VFGRADQVRSARRCAYRCTNVVASDREWARVRRRIGACTGRRNGDRSLRLQRLDGVRRVTASMGRPGGSHFGVDRRARGTRWEESVGIVRAVLQRPWVRWARKRDARGDTRRDVAHPCRGATIGCGRWIQRRWQRWRRVAAVRPDRRRRCYRRSSRAAATAAARDHHAVRERVAAATVFFGGAGGGSAGSACNATGAVATACGSHATAAAAGTGGLPLGWVNEPCAATGQPGGVGCRRRRW